MSFNTGVSSHSLLPGYLPDPGIEPVSPALQGDSLPSEPPGKPFNTCLDPITMFTIRTDSFIILQIPLCCLL